MNIYSSFNSNNTDIGTAHILRVMFITLIFVQFISFLSYFYTPEISNVIISSSYPILLNVILITIFFDLGVYFFILLFKSRKNIRFYIQSNITIKIFNNRILSLLILNNLILLFLFLLFGSLRREVFVSYYLILSIPISIIATKFPLFYLATTDVLNYKKFIFIFFHYLFLSIIYTSKMGLIYIFFVFIIFANFKFLLFIMPIIILIFFFMIFNNENFSILFYFDSKTLYDFTFIIFESILNRFDSIRVSLFVLSSELNILSIKNWFDAFLNLMPNCSAKDNCLNLSAQISQQLIGIDIDNAVYEINIASEALIFFGKIGSLIYSFIAGFILCFISSVIYLKFKSRTYTLPIGLLSLFLLPTSMWSATLFSTRSFISLFIEIFFIIFLVKLLVRKKWL
jgi:hypothetical protein